MEIPRHWRIRGERLRLEGSNCQNCGEKHFPARPVCPDCAEKRIDQSHGNVYPADNITQQTPVLVEQAPS